MSQNFAPYHGGLRNTGCHVRGDANDGTKFDWPGLNSLSHMKKKRGIDDPETTLINCLEEFATVGLTELDTPGGEVAQFAVFGMISVLDGNYEIWNKLQAADFKNKHEFFSLLSCQIHLAVKIGN